MKYQVLDSFNAMTSKGEMSLKPGQVITLPESLVERLINQGKIGLLDPFENLQRDLWPKLIHCSWCDLTKEEKVEWEIAIKIQGQAEGAEDIKKWQAMASTLIRIAEDVKERILLSKENLLSLSLNDMRLHK